ncbi:non-receptor serine/threonine protein kinase [Lithospermum erythrorhizon]|uniref:Non-receptor serine/threonine protein kinase n=1 Tax=Lithospermum erythrorhizon TaxID=34254 RepID=A0AAV3R047_LITER
MCRNSLVQGTRAALSMDLRQLDRRSLAGLFQLPDFKLISFGKIDNPIGLEASLPGCSPDEINLVKKLMSLNPTSRATVMELLHDKYLNEEPFPVQVSELKVPSKHTDRDDIGTDSYMEDFGPMSVTNTKNGFSISIFLSLKG